VPVALKATLTKAELDALPEAVRGLYHEKDGKWWLDVEGGLGVPSSEVQDLKSKLAEFRDNNVALLKKVTDLEPLAKKYEGIDPDEARRLKEEHDKLQKKGVTKADDIEALVKAAVETATKPIAEKLASEEQARKAAQQAADQARFRELVSSEAQKKGVRPSSVRHVIREAEQTFDLKDGALAPKAGVKHPSDPLKELTPDVWLEGLAKSDDYLFEPSVGGGADNQNGRHHRPGAKQLVNPTAEEMGRNVDAIAKGEIVVVRN
jgi:hypothetical protein